MFQCVNAMTSETTTGMTGEHQEPQEVRQQESVCGERLALLICHTVSIGHIRPIGPIAQSRKFGFARLRRMIALIRLAIASHA